ncbi:MAG TPA: hypothetical protein VE487_03740 [Ilumatobacter sp.]|nr:hypothetical protein [Ilumatobacter sp.]
MSRPRFACGRVAPWLAMVTAAFAALAACSDGDDGDGPAASSSLTTVVVADTQPTSSSTTAATPVTSGSVASTAAVTSAPTTEESGPGTTAAPPIVALSGETLEIASPLMTNPFMLERVGVFGGLVVYDGESVDGDFVLRCVAVGHDGETTWSEWCALPGDSSSFVVVEGINPWVVDVGAEHLDVTMTQMPSEWAVTSSGCVDPLVIMIDAAEVLPAVATSIACAGDEAFITYSSVFMQAGPPDGGGLLLTSGDEGWNAETGGTSIPCATDGDDRCARFGVEEELFEATSPIPSPDQLAAQQDYVAVREVTGDARAMATEATDLETITEAIVAALAPPDAEVEPAVVRHDGVDFDQYSLLVVDVPAADDSVGSTTWVVWITTETPEVPSNVHRAYAWENCTRGVADSQTCV